jgi:hypothetical protein
MQITSFDPQILIRPRYASNPGHVNKLMTLEQFANGEPIQLYVVEETNDYFCKKGRYSNNQWIEGPEQ